jgi:hypothetical protein
MRRIVVRGVVSVVLAGAGLAGGGVAGAAPAAGFGHPACVWGARVLPGPVGPAPGGVLGTDGPDRFAGTIGSRAVVWQRGRVTVLAGDFAAAQDVNRSGIAVGTAAASPGSRQAVLWRGAAATPLAVPAGLDITEVTGISDAGVIVGNAWQTIPDPDAFILRPHGLVWSAARPNQVRDLTPARWTACGCTASATPASSPER